jgi:hypothetical protein
VRSSPCWVCASLWCPRTRSPGGSVGMRRHGDCVAGRAVHYDSCARPIDLGGHPLARPWWDAAQRQSNLVFPQCVVAPQAVSGSFEAAQIFALARTCAIRLGRPRAIRHPAASLDRGRHLRRWAHSDSPLACHLHRALRHHVPSRRNRFRAQVHSIRASSPF